MSSPVSPALPRRREPERRQVLAASHPAEPEQHSGQTWRPGGAPPVLPGWPEDKTTVVTMTDRQTDMAAWRRLLYCQVGLRTRQQWSQ